MAGPYNIPAAVEGAGDPAADFNAARAAILDLDARVLNTGIPPYVVPSMGITDVRWTMPPAIVAGAWNGDDHNEVTFMPITFAVPWQMRQVQAFFAGLGDSAAGARIGLYASSVLGKPNGSPLIQMVRTGAQMGGPTSSPVSFQFDFSDTTWRTPGTWYIGYTHYGTGMSIRVFSAEPSSLRARVAISPIGPGGWSGNAVEWWTMPVQAGNVLPNNVVGTDVFLSNVDSLPWLSLGFSAP